ncbi:hypothetical protein BSZ37_20590 [Rubrivirga marina]|uniref:Uncharacterized protein n=1 Tax=Rubrivirga marina TaxID=1196024 RepID=A0A271IVJ9_9BACT|nr:hypothetical protein BSZ37_20590 [Rubrivirga marina]
MASTLDPSDIPSPMSVTSRSALVVLIPISEPAVTRATSAPPAAAVSPHWRVSLCSGLARRSAPQ